MVSQNSSFTNGNLEVQEGRSRSVCLQNFLPFCQYIFHLLDGGFLYINTKYKGAVINKAFNCGKARLDLTQGMWQQLHWGVWIQSSQYNLPRKWGTASAIELYIIVTAWNELALIHLCAMCYHWVTSCDVSFLTFNSGDSCYHSSSIVTLKWL